MSKTNISKVVAINYAKLVDRLGELNAQLAPVKDEIEEIKDTLRESGFEALEGDLFRVTVGITDDVPVTDYKTIAISTIRTDILLQLIEKHTRYTEKKGAVRIVAKVR